jgi:protein-S-isoprenylcysteine O-methyltransferase Ste14
MVGAVAMHAVVPLELSRLGDRVDRRGRTRGAVQTAGLLTVAAGAALMAWAFAAHYEAAPRSWALESWLKPEHLLRTGPYRLDYLLRRGPYRLTRNPIYVGEAVVWLGWALFYATPAVRAGLVVGTAMLGVALVLVVALIVPRRGVPEVSPAANDRPALEARGLARSGAKEESG